MGEDCAKKTVHVRLELKVNKLPVFPYTQKNDSE